MGINAFPGDIKSAYQATAPTNPRVGDIWVDSASDIASVDLVPSKITGHNLLHNGAMQVHQRGTSTATAYPTGFTVSGYYTADRWNQVVATIGNWTQTVENDGPTGSGFRKSVKVYCDTADASPASSDRLVLQQIMEGQNLQSIKKGTASAEQLTLSFWVKSNKTGTYVASLIDVDNTRVVSATYTINVSGTWEQKSITFPADTTGTLNNDNDQSLSMQFFLAAGSDFTGGTLATSWESYAGSSNMRAVGQTNLASTIGNYWQITGVQLETGPSATNYEFKDYGQELRECQRYYWRVSGNNQTIGPAFARTATDCYSPILFHPPMRATPNIDVSNSAGYFTAGLGASNFTVATLSFQNPTSTGGLIAGTSMSGMTAGTAGWFFCSNASAYIGFSADL